MIKTLNLIRKNVYLDKKLLKRIEKERKLWNKRNKCNYSNSIFLSFLIILGRDIYKLRLK